MATSVAFNTTPRKPYVAFSARDVDFIRNYGRGMLAEWLRTGLKASGMGQAELSRRLTTQLGRSIDRAAVNKMISGGRRISADEMIAISAALKIEPPIDASAEGSSFRVSGANAGPSMAPAPAGYRVEPNATFEGPVKLPPRNGPADIEELGITVGGLGDDDSAFAFNGQVIDMVTRPPGIANRKGVFALRVGNTSMVPKFEDGERVYVEPRKPAIGDYVVIELHPTEEGRPGKSFIKRLVAMNSARVEVEQFNPKGRLEFERAEIKDVFRVIPIGELLGM